jgi:hypothetical protein
MVFLSFYRRNSVRSLCCFVSLGWLAVIGCAIPEATRGRQPLASAVIRGESDGLVDLESAAHSRQRTDSDKHGRTAIAKTTHKHHRSHCTTCNQSPCSCQGSTEGNLFGQIFWGFFATPFAVPSFLLHDDHDHFAEFPDYPYADDLPGSLLIDSSFKGKTQTWTGNIQAVAIPSSHELERFGGRLLLENSDRIGLDTETNYWLSTGSQAGPRDAWTGDFNLTYRFAESEQIQLRAGIGVNWLADQIRPEFGVNFTYGIDWFPHRPWTISSIIDVGSLGSAMLFHNRSTIGVMLGPTELLVGYDYFQLGNARFQGPVAGIGYRF